MKTRWTDEELMRMDHPGKVELVRGELILMRPAGLHEGAVCVGIATLLHNHVNKHKLGRVFDARTGFRPHEDMRAPDVSFVHRDRLPEGRLPKGFGRFAPDLAVEVFAPGDKPADYAAKMLDYFDWGVRLVWLVDPDTRTVSVYRSPADAISLAEGDELSGEDVVPGFTCRVSELFE